MVSAYLYSSYNEKNKRSPFFQVRILARAKQVNDRILVSWRPLHIPNEKTSSTLLVELTPLGSNKIKNPLRADYSAFKLAGGESSTWPLDSGSCVLVHNSQKDSLMFLRLLLVTEDKPHVLQKGLVHIVHKKSE